MTGIELTRVSIPAPIPRAVAHWRSSLVSRKQAVSLMMEHRTRDDTDDQHVVRQRKKAAAPHGAEHVHGAEVLAYCESGEQRVLNILRGEDQDVATGSLAQVAAKLLSLSLKKPGWLEEPYVLDPAAVPEM
jgi:hypothetical protein